MPMTEQYKVNNPIIISENGQILSNESNNEYLLPYFGINSPKSFERNNIIEEDKIIIVTRLLNFGTCFLAMGHTWDFISVQKSRNRCLVTLA